MGAAIVSLWSMFVLVASSLSNPNGIYEAYCDFDYGFCHGFVNANEADYEFELNSGRTPSSGTGPFSDCDADGKGGCKEGNGQYIYLEASYPHQAGKAAVLQLPLVQSSGQSCFEFAYSMNGLGMGSLQAFVNNELVWEKFGDQGTQWHVARVPVNVSGLVILRLRAIRGVDYTSDIALDSVGFKNLDCNQYSRSTTLSTTTSAGRSTTPLDVCQLLPCVNGGTCISVGNAAFICKCPAGYMGTFCEQNSNPCVRNPCRNGGTCVTVGGSYYYCQCIIGWKGANCQIPLDICESQPCQNGGVCVGTTSSQYQCFCPPNCVGSLCETCAITTSPTTLSPTTLLPTTNWSTTTLGSTLWSTSTQTPCVTVSTTPTVASVCQPSLCLNGGLCTRVGLRGFECRCVESFVGQFCERMIMKDELMRCDFDDSWCDFYNAWFDDFDWQESSGKVPGAPWTGPTADHNRPGRGKYIYAASTRAGTRAIVYSGLVAPGRHCITFWYLMWGSGVGRLRVFVRLTDQTLLSIYGNQGPDWQRAYIFWEGFVSQIGFMAAAGADQFGVIAIDDVVIYWGFCWITTPLDVGSKPLPVHYRPITQPSF